MILITPVVRHQFASILVHGLFVDPEWPVAIRVEQYSAAVRCPHRGYAIRFLSGKLTERRKAPPVRPNVPYINV
jgi:hypothetical protein